jgi:hypothetical protein
VVKCLGKSTGYPSVAFSPLTIDSVICVVSKSLPQAGTNEYLKQGSATDSQQAKTVWQGISFGAHIYKVIYFLFLLNYCKITRNSGKNIYKNDCSFWGLVGVNLQCRNY